MTTFNSQNEEISFRRFKLHFSAINFRLFQLAKDVLRLYVNKYSGTSGKLKRVYTTNINLISYYKAKPKPKLLGLFVLMLFD